MRKTSKVLSLVLAVALALSMTACGGGKTADSTKAETAATTTAATEAAEAKTEAAKEETKAEESKTDAPKEAAATDKTFKIGVLQLTQHAALDSANEGFFAALDEAGVKYEADQQNASGEQSNCQTIAEKLVNDGSDLILAIATPAAQTVAGLTSDIPVILTAVTDPAESGLVADNKAPGGNVTGTSDLTPVKEQIDLLQQLIPDVKTVGILFCSAESNSEIQAQMAREALDAAGIEHKDYTVSNSNEIQTVVESMIGKVDAVYAPTDNVIAAGMATVGMVANDNNIPVICGEGGMVEAGGLATYGIDYYQLGYLAGQQAIQILVDGVSPAEIPIGYLPADKCELKINDETATALGIDTSVVK